MRAHGDEPAGRHSSPGNGRYQFPDEALAVWRHEPMVLEAYMFRSPSGGVWDYPYPEAQTLIEDMKNKFGAHRLMWEFGHAERGTVRHVQAVARLCEAVLPVS